MTKEESAKIVDKIKIYRQSFLITSELYQEWYRILEPYDYYDVNNKLDNYFRNSDNFGKYPDAYYLVKFLKTIEEKKVLSEPHVICEICKKPLKHENYAKHYERCSSIEYLVEMSKRYLNKNLSRKKLEDTSDTTFNEYYYSTCKLIFDNMPDGFPKHLLENVLLTYKGKKPKCNLDSISKEMSSKW